MPLGTVTDLASMGVTRDDEKQKPAMLKVYDTRISGRYAPPHSSSCGGLLSRTMHLNLFLLFYTILVIRLLFIFELLKRLNNLRCMVLERSPPQELE